MFIRVHQWLSKLGSVVVTAVAVDLAADFAAGPARTVNIYVSSTGTYRRKQFVKFSSADSSFVREVGHIRRCDGSRYRSWWRWAGLGPSRTIAEIGAKEHADRTSHAFCPKWI